MHLVVVGVNHKTAPLELREQLTVKAEDFAAALAKLRSHPNIDEVCIISTCNRTELYAVTCSRAEDDVLVGFMAEYGGVTPEDLSSCTYRYAGHHAVEHLFSVSSGLDSMALGETQILGQIKDAYCVAGECASTGTVLNSLFQRAIAVGKRARTDTDISCGAFSIGAAAAQLAKEIFTDLKGRKALLLGAGEMSKLAANHLIANGVDKVYVAGRTRSRVEALTNMLGGEPMDFERFEDVLHEVDFVISSTGAPHPVITMLQMQRIMAERDNSPILLIDIAVPRDVEPEVGEIDGVHVYNIDDLQILVDRCRSEREGEAQKVSAIVEEETTSFMAYLRTLEAMPLIRQLREKFEAVCTYEWKRYSSRLSHLPEEDQEYVRKLLKSTVNKLTHDPILRIKDYAVSGEDKHKLGVVWELFGLIPLDGHEKEEGSRE